MRETRRSGRRRANEPSRSNTSGKTGLPAATSAHRSRSRVAASRSSKRGDASGVACRRSSSGSPRRTHRDAARRSIACSKRLLPSPAKLPRWPNYPEPARLAGRGTHRRQLRTCQRKRNRGRDASASSSEIPSAGGRAPLAHAQHAPPIKVAPRSAAREGFSRYSRPQQRHRCQQHAGQRRRPIRESSSQQTFTRATVEHQVFEWDVGGSLQIGPSIFAQYASISRAWPAKVSGTPQ